MTLSSNSLYSPLLISMFDISSISFNTPRISMFLRISDKMSGFRVISLNILSQLPILPSVFLEEHLQIKQDDIQKMARTIIKCHLDYLLNFSGTVCLITDIEREIFNNNDVASRQNIIEQLIPYIKDEIKKGTRLNQIMRHTLGLFHGQTGASYWKRYLSENMCVRDADIKKIDHIMDKINFNNVDTSVGQSA